MTADTQTLLVSAQAAMEEGDWAAARTWFETALEHEETAEALGGLGDALWWLGETERAVRATERAFTAFRNRSDPANAAFAAIGLYFVYRVSLGNVAASRGWLGRAASLVEEFGLDPLSGWILLMRANDTSDPLRAEAWARQAHQLARTFEDRDLELCALSEVGAALISQGRVDDGVPLIDEAMAGSLAGEGERLDTVVYTSCSMITACSQIAELERVIQWIRAADAFTHQYGCPHLYTVCRTYYGTVLFAVGRWSEAEHELEAAMKMGRTAERVVFGEALARLADLRLAQGEIEEAEQLVSGYENDVAVAPVLVGLHLAAGRPGAAASLLRRRLRGSEEESGAIVGYRVGAALVLERARLRELLVEAELGRNDLEAASAEADQLHAEATAVGWDVVVASGLRALGRAHAAAGRVDDASVCLERALSVFARLGMPLEAARSQLLLATALGTEDRETAVAETRAALAAFQTLGAARDADQASAFLRSLGGHVGRVGPRKVSLLSKRELEVLRLLAQGLTNRQISERLYVSLKTVEHHVRSVFTKLDFSNRAEAAAYAARTLEPGSSTD